MQWQKICICTRMVPKFSWLLALLRKQRWPREIHFCSGSASYFCCKIKEPMRIYIIVKTFLLRVSSWDRHKNTVFSSLLVKLMVHPCFYSVDHSSKSLSSSLVTTKLEPLDDQSSPSPSRAECLSAGPPGSTGTQSLGAGGTGASNAALPIPQDPVVPDSSSMSSFSVENIMTSMSTSSLGGGSDYASALMGSSRGMVGPLGGTAAGGSSLLSPPGLPTYHRGTDPYRSPSCSSQGSTNNNNTQASSPSVNNYHCSQSVFHDGGQSSRQHMSIQDDVMTSQNNVTNVTSSVTSPNVLNIAPQPTPASYSRVNWYMSPSSSDVTSMTSDMTSAYANMFGQATSQSCQLSAAAFRTPYKNTGVPAYPAYDCGKYWFILCMNTRRLNFFGWHGHRCTFHCQFIQKTIPLNHSHTGRSTFSRAAQERIHQMDASDWTGGRENVSGFPYMQQDARMVSAKNCLYPRKLNFLLRRVRTQADCQDNTRRTPTQLKMSETVIYKSLLDAMTRNQNPQERKRLSAHLCVLSTSYGFYSRRFSNLSAHSRSWINGIHNSVLRDLLKIIFQVFLSQSVWNKEWTLLSIFEQRDKNWQCPQQDK